MCNDMEYEKHKFAMRRIPGKKYPLELEHHHVLKLRALVINDSRERRKVGANTNTGDQIKDKLDEIIRKQNLKDRRNQEAERHEYGLGYRERVVPRPFLQRPDPRFGSNVDFSLDSVTKELDRGNTFDDVVTGLMKIVMPTIINNMFNTEEDKPMFKVNQVVFCTVFGYGQVELIDSRNNQFPIKVKFEVEDRNDRYTIDGRYAPRGLQTLFASKQEAMEYIAKIEKLFIPLTFDYIKEKCKPNETVFVDAMGVDRLFVGWTKDNMIVTERTNTPSLLKSDENDIRHLKWTIKP